MRWFVLFMLIFSLSGFSFADKDNEVRYRKVITGPVGRIKIAYNYQLFFESFPGMVRDLLDLDFNCLDYVELGAVSLRNHCFKLHVKEEVK